MLWLQTVVSPEVLLVLVVLTSGHEIIDQSSCSHTPSSVHPSLARHQSVKWKLEMGSNVNQVVSIVRSGITIMEKCLSPS